jgi:hypothetical protein
MKHNGTYTIPPKKMWGGLYFFILLRILGAEYKGKVIGLFPFVPYKIIGRVTARGLDWNDVPADVDLASLDTKLDIKQAISFLCIYVLSTLTVKFYVHKLVAIQPPKGADQGFMTVAESPMVKNTLNAFGINPDDLKME